MRPDFQDDGDIQFPVITISVSHDDMDEPIHVDLGSIPPFVASAVLDKVASILRAATPAPKITFKGNVLVEPFNANSVTMIDNLFDAFLEEEDKNDEEDE
jgi:hypothetical protein